MNTQHTVLLMGALAKVMELSRTRCSVLAEQTTISLHALNQCPELPLSLKAQIEEMLDALEEQYQLDRIYQERAKSNNPSVNAFCIKPAGIHKALLYADTSLV
ncbi:hypothetical protein PHIN9_07170 [Polynucleobacter sp. HIN9]|nr:hypothetical protein PHIN9_07170 [Polynucleobacter sp. HIN9]